MDAVAISTRDESKRVAISNLNEHAARAGNEFWLLQRVVFAPDAVSFCPLAPRQQRRAIHSIPVWRIVLFEFGKAPGNPHRAKHGEVSRCICGMRIEQRAVPIE